MWDQKSFLITDCVSLLVNYYIINNDNKTQTEKKQQLIVVKYDQNQSDYPYDYSGEESFIKVTINDDEDKIFILNKDSGQKCFVVSEDAFKNISIIYD